jgi:hypothetical protein
MRFAVKEQRISQGVDGLWLWAYEVAAPDGTPVCSESGTAPNHGEAESALAAAMAEFIRLLEARKHPYELVHLDDDRGET